MRFIIAGGGTGGHIYPAIAIAKALQSRDARNEILFVGAMGKMEMEKVPKEGFKIIGLEIVGFNRTNIFKNILLPWKLWKSRKKAINILKEFKPDVVIGVGGFASFPVLNAAQSMGIPTLIQEQNSYAGKTNKIIGKKAKKICVAYDNMDQFFPKEKIEITGNPVREIITNNNCKKEDSIENFGLKIDVLTVLIVGGSLGAKSINESIENGLSKLMEQSIQLIWQTGKLFRDKGKELAEKYKGRIYAAEFIYEMDKAYAAADMVVSRAGALSIAELCVAGKPVIFVPYPFAAEDHQTSNAMALVNKEAGILVKDSEAPDNLCDALINLVNDESTRNKLKTNISLLGIKDADNKIVNEIYKILEKK